ncbi:MAG: hypothetical protein RLZZ338_4850 [Cyanobacteriota bacterium]|jgi:hypothetical protein
MNGHHTPFSNGHTFQIPQSATVVEFPSSAQPAIDYEYQMRLFSLWIDEIKSTGRIDNPELVQFLNHVYEVENSPEGTVLLQQQYDVLVENLKSAQTDIREATQKIQRHLNEIAQALPEGEFSDSQKQEIRGGIRTNTQQFLRGVEYLLDVTQHHVCKTSSFWKKFIRRTEDSEAETVRKWMKDLDYIREYIAKQAQFGVLADGFLLENPNAHDFRRLQKYLEEAPSLADLLGNSVQQKLNHKVAGGTKFAVPKAY